MCDCLSGPIIIGPIKSHYIIHENNVTLQSSKNVSVYQEIQFRKLTFL